MLFCKKLGTEVNVHNIEKCPLCEGSRFEKVITCIDHYATGEPFEIWRCNDCGFLFTQAFPTEAEMGRYYESPDYIPHSDTNKGIVNRIYHWVRLFMLSRKASLIRRHSGLSSGTLLDIGAGTGYFPYCMKKKGWDVSAIEKSAAARDFAKEHFSLDMDTAETLQRQKDKFFDVITLWHVMEHLENLNETWETLHRILKDSGTLFVAVPNPMSSDAMKYKETWAAYDVPRHLWHFSPSVMRRFGDKHGFTLYARHPMPFDGFYVSILSEKYSKSRFPFFKGFASGIGTWLSSAADKDRSSSMIYIFKKKEV